MPRRTSCSSSSEPIARSNAWPGISRSSVILRGSGLQLNRTAQFLQNFLFGVRRKLLRALPRRIRACEQRRFSLVGEAGQIDADVLIRAGCRGAPHLRADSGIGERGLKSDARDLPTQLDYLGTLL